MTALDPSLVAAFRRDGHVTVRGLAAPEVVAAVRPAIAAVVDEIAAAADPQGRIDDYGALFTQVTNAWRRSETVRAFVFDPGFARAAAELLGVPGVRLYHDQALVKEPDGQPTPWHQDQYYWPLDTTDTVTLWMPLVDVTAEMGPMTFASGSHAIDWPLRPIGEETHAALAAEIARRGLPIGGGQPLRAGDATFHRGTTVHAAGANRSRTRREVMTIIYFADGARVVEPDNEHRRADRDAFLPGLAAGDRAAGPLNPLLYPALRTTPDGTSSDTSRSPGGGRARR